MAWITDKTRLIWESGQFVGENTPHAVVQIQLGHWIRGWYQVDHMVFPNDAAAAEWDGVRANIWGEGNYGGPNPQLGHWAAKWIPSEGYNAELPNGGPGVWHTLPNLASIKRTRDLSQNGITVLEVLLDAQDYVPKTGAFGDAYHALVPGWLAPTRNYQSANRPVPAWQQADQLSSEWAPLAGDGSPAQGRISDSVAIRVWQGYGPPETGGDGSVPPVDGGTNGAWVFRGMIDDVDLDGDPNTITITARNGKLLTDQRVFRASKSVQLKDPIAFYDKQAATVKKLVGSGASASHSDAAYPAKNVLDQPHRQWNINDAAYDTEWRSVASIADNLEWVEIRLPQGQYEGFWLVAPAGLTCYVAIYAMPILHWEGVEEAGGALLGLEANSGSATMDGVAIPEGWVDLGIGNAPGGAGGWPIIRSFETGTTLPGSPSPGDMCLDRPSLQHTFELGQHSILRIGLQGGSGVARVADLHGIHRVVDKQITKQQFILVDDATEIVKVVLRWAGFVEWTVEDAMVRLSAGTTTSGGVVSDASGRLTFNRSQTLLEIIQEVGKQLGFIFFIADPTDAHSDGIPTFRRDSSLLIDANYIAASVTDGNMLTGMKVKHSDESKPAVIRVRGKSATAREGGTPLGWEPTSRIMATYFAPWWFGSGMGGVLRHVVYEDDQIVTYAQCLFGAMLIALNSALLMHTGIVEIPAHPIIELDNQVSIIDEATGTNSRLWITQTEDNMVLGQDASWKMTLQGALVDSKDMHDVIDQLLGNAPITVGYAGTQEVIDHIDWNNVVDPNTGDVSGHPADILRVGVAGSALLKVQIR